MKKAWLEDKKIKIKIGGEDFHDNLDIVKSLHGREYDPATKIWTALYSSANIDTLYENQFDLSSDLAMNVVEDVSGDWEDQEVVLPEFANGYNLYPFQAESLKYLKAHKNRGVLGLPMGSGKTLVSLSFIKSTEDSLPALVICPSPVKRGFLNDYKKFFGNTDDIEILYGMDSLAKYKKQKIYVINYEILSRSIETRKVEYRNSYGSMSKRVVRKPSHALERFATTGFQTIIADECHRLKNEDSNAFHAFRFLSDNAKYVVGMSGTPVLSHPYELWSYWNVIKPRVFQSKRFFLSRYCEPRTIHVGGGRRITLYDGAANLMELNHTLRNNGMLIMDKKEILQDLPDEPTKTVIPLELENYSEYVKEKNAVLDEISQNRKLALTLFEKLKQAAVKLKMKYIFSYIDDLLEIEKKVVVFAVHQKVIEQIHKKYKNSVIFNGTISEKQKNDNKEQFINDPDTNLIIGNIQSMGTGVDGLQKSGASTILFVELPWNPSELDQARDRLWRDGFVGSKGINVYYLVGQGTIEEQIVARLDSKKSVVEATIKGTDVEEEDLLSFLMQQYIDEARNK
jgi:SWI/SNF-related matrix-associated actin-dependent regulator of chromatin subfamily A-like protein 1